MEEMVISIGVVAYNEEAYLPYLLADICAQTYPRHQLEVVLVDGGSKDRTRELMERFRDREKGFFGVQVLDNPKRIQAAGWNVAFRHFRGGALARIDAHGRIPADFIARNAALLARGEMVTGGMRANVIEGGSAWKQLLLAAENSMFGSGIASCRRKGERRYVSSLFHACYRREVLEKVGLMDERLGRTEDNEFHYRIRKAGYRICSDPKICSFQYARPALPAMLAQKYGNGYWIGLTTSVCPGCLSAHHYVPGLFLGGIAAATLLAAAGHSQPKRLLWGGYGSLCGLMAAADLVRRKTLSSLFLVPLFFLLHVSYGMGTWVGLFDAFVRRKIPGGKTLADQSQGPVPGHGRGARAMGGQM